MQTDAIPSANPKLSWPQKLGWLFLLCIIADFFYLAALWPNWQTLSSGPIPKSAFIKEYEKDRKSNHHLPPLQWSPVSLNSLPKYLIRAAIVAEDSGFYNHEGVDWDAIGDALDYNLEKGDLIRGGSTISQQVAKNLFLSSSRSPLRKWHELILTWAMERNLSKSRILSIYLNVAEFGQGVYGVEAAAHRYWGISASAVSMEQAADLAATLPSPKNSNPASRTRAFMHRRERILRWLQKIVQNAK
jgi:monofunctional glycosyltransferase